MSRRTPNKPETTKISIEPWIYNPFSKDSYQVRKERYAQFTRESSSITAAGFVAVVQEVSNLRLIGNKSELTEIPLGNGSYGDLPGHDTS